MRLALSGAVDFRRARVREPGWWRKVNALVGELRARDNVRLLEALYRFQCALAANGGLTNDSFQKVKENARQTCAAIVDALQPWADAAAAGGQEETIERLVADYKALVGDPSDPAFRAREEAALAAERQRREAPKPEAEEARVERLLAERDAQRRRRAAPRR